MRASLADTTEYFDGVNPDRLAAIKPYEIQPGPYGREGIEQLLCSWNMHHCYGPEHHKKTPFICVDPLVRYRDLLEGFCESGRYNFVPYKDFSLDIVDDDAVTALIRHDVDGDIVAATEMARIEAEYGIRSTYFVLHTAPYHATFEDGIVHRYDDVVELYLEIQELGHEIAIHTDILGLYQDHQLDGASGFQAELDWLRSRGVHIEGTLAHNSFGVYGANNYTMFEGRPLTDYFGAGSAKAVEHNGRWSPLQQLDEAALGLQYEGNEVFWQHEVPVHYWCLMHQGMWARQPNFYGTRLPERLRPQTALTWMSQEEVLDDSATVPSGEIAVIVVHPLHYGLRCHENEAPSTAITRTLEPGRDWLSSASAAPSSPARVVTEKVSDVAPRSRLKQLVGREPRSHSLPISITASYAGERVETTGIYVDYGDGLLDRPADYFSAETKHRVLFVGGPHLGGRLLGSESRVSQLLPRQLHHIKGHLVDDVRSMVWSPDRPDGRSFDRLLRTLGDTRSPTTVIAGFTASELSAHSSLITRLTEGSGEQFTLFALAVPESYGANPLGPAVGEALATQVFDPADRFDAYRARTGRSLFWESNGHWNQQAHWLTAQLLVDGLEAYFFPPQPA